jgi:3-phenylpropionate/trans-cinnamate dioxygenase ferredoxin reductase subunit
VADRSVDFLLIGGGLASANCARWLREEGADGSILLVGREPTRPYNRPPLSKGYLQGKETVEDFLFRPDEWWDEQRIEVLTGTSVMKLDTAERVATLSNKETVRFDKALVATGAIINRLRASGAADLDGIHYLRAIGNSDAIQRDAEQASRVVLVGAGYIGTEVAASLTAAHGKQCSIVMLEDVILERFYGKEVGGYFQRVLERNGVEVHGGQEVERFEGTDGRVSKVVTKEGLELDCDMVVIGVGVSPDVMLARSAGLELGEGGGVRCSSKLETSVPGIYAAGDMCEYDSVVHGKPMRIEHWDVAFNQGKTAALNMLGRETDHDVIPYFFSDFADWTSLEYVGPGSGDTVIRGSMDDDAFTAFYLAGDGKVTAALTVGRSDDLEHAKRFIREGTAPERGALADEGRDLGEAER